LICCCDTHNETLQPLFICDVNLHSETERIGEQTFSNLIDSPQLAVEIAKIILKDAFGEELISKEMPFSVNCENDIWIIEGNLPKNNKPNVIWIGGVAHIEIKKTGEVLVLYHSE
jgi:hypothetical protein